MQRGDEGGGEQWRRGRWEGLDLKVLLVLRNINEEASQWRGWGRWRRWRGRRGPLRDSERPKQEGGWQDAWRCLLGEVQMTQAGHSERQRACYAELRVLAERMQCVGEEEEDEEEGWW